MPGPQQALSAALADLHGDGVAKLRQRISTRQTVLSPGAALPPCAGAWIDGGRHLAADLFRGAAAATWG